MITIIPLLDGSEIALELSPETAAIVKSLEHDLSAYFTQDTGGEMPIAPLRQNRARVDGIANAARLMKDAAAGKTGKRGPVSIRRLENGIIEVVDGNSTVTVARAAGWPTIWAEETVVSQVAHQL